MPLDLIFLNFSLYLQIFRCNIFLFMRLDFFALTIIKGVNMNITKAIGLTFFCVGIVILLFAFTATQTLLESSVKWFAGYYTEHTMIALIGGIAMLICGGLLAFRFRE